MSRRDKASAPIVAGIRSQASALLAFDRSPPAVDLSSRSGGSAAQLAGPERCSLAKMARARSPGPAIACATGRPGRRTIQSAAAIFTEIVEAGRFNNPAFVTHPDIDMILTDVTLG